MAAPVVPNVFIVGKGGVGKSTVTALLSILLKSAYTNVYIVSLDPAHNQADIWQRPLSEKPAQVYPGVSVVQMDMDRWTADYLKQARENIKTQYNYLSAFNLDKHLNIMKYAPGLHEYALMLAFNFVRKTYRNADILLFDMPPTALALRFFNLPQLSILWLDKLIELRQDILNKKEIKSKIQFGKRTWENDKILSTLYQQKETYQSVADIFRRDQYSKVMITLNPDALSVSESLSIRNSLAQIQLPVAGLFLNKVGEATDRTVVSNKIDENIIMEFPLSDQNLTGAENLVSYINQRLQDVNLDYFIKNSLS